MSEFKENLKKAERFLKVAQMHEEHCNYNNLYDFLSIDRTATKEKIKARIEEKYKCYLSEQNVNDCGALTKAFISSQPAIEYILCKCRAEYGNHLIDLKVKALRKHFISLTGTDRELDAKNKKAVIKEGIEAGLSETTIIKIIGRWMKKDGIKRIEALSSSESPTSHAHEDLLDETHYEIFEIPNNADYPEIKQIYDQEHKKYINAGDKARWNRVSEGSEILKDRDNRDTYDNKVKESGPAVEDEVPVLKVICKMDNYYVYKDVKKGTPFTETIVIKNDDKGQLKGKISSDAEWLVPETDVIAPDHEQTLEIYILTANMPANKYDAKGTVTINTNGGPPYSISFRVILQDLEIAVNKFRKTCVPVAIACAGFIGSFSDSPFLFFPLAAIFAGIISYSAAEFIVTATLKNGLNILKFPSIVMQCAAGSVAVLTLLSHSSGSAIIKRTVEQEKPGIAVSSGKPQPLPTLSESGKMPVILYQADHNQQFSLIDEILIKETVASPDGLISMEPKTVDFADFWQPCEGSACPLTAAVEANTNAQNTLHQSPLVEVEMSRSIGAETNRTMRRNTHIASSMVNRKKWKPKISSFAPPSRDDL